MGYYLPCAAWYSEKKPSGHSVQPWHLVVYTPQSSSWIGFPGPEDCTVNTCRYITDTITAVAITGLVVSENQQHVGAQFVAGISSLYSCNFYFRSIKMTATNMSGLNTELYRCTSMCLIWEIRWGNVML